MAETQHFFPEHLMRRVFTKEFVSRLEAVNRVARELRASPRQACRNWRCTVSGPSAPLVTANERWMA